MKRNNKKIIRSVTASRSVGFFLDSIPELKQKGYEVVSVSSFGPELNRLREMGVKVIEVPMERRMSPIKDLRALFVLIKVFCREKPCMVHSMTPKAGLLCMLAACLTGVPYRLHTFTGLVWPTATGLSRKILMVTDWLTCVCATHVIPEGQGVLCDLQKYITKKPMKVLGCGNVRGVDMVRFSLRPEVVAQSMTLKKKNLFTFIFVGRIVGDKGINELVWAFTKLHEKYVNIRLFLVGSYEANLDPLKPESLEYININSAIEVVGPKYGDNLLAYYVASNCFVLPSYREGFPNTVLEAGALSLPSIVTDINGSREIIEHGTNGIIIPSKDAAALYNAMEKMVLNKEDAQKLASNARSMIELRFEQSFVRECLYDFYDEIMNSDC